MLDKPSAIPKGIEGRTIGVIDLKYKTKSATRAGPARLVAARSEKRWGAHSGAGLARASKSLRGKAFDFRLSRAGNVHQWGRDFFVGKNCGALEA